ncbi:hypothetical protein N0V85_000175 [Neurospora sp. IMI 360204]|nr:hypothetical protein N0V85_000175 [Neurospora sp. IMI 360204]
MKTDKALAGAKKKTGDAEPRFKWWWWWSEVEDDGAEANELALCIHDGQNLGGAVVKGPGQGGGGGGGGFGASSIFTSVR